MWKIRERYKTESIRERAEPYPTPMSMLKKGEEKLFQKNIWFFYLLNSFGKRSRPWG